MKTPVMVLQEVMVQRGKLPMYEFVDQTGPSHCPKFMCRCEADGPTAFASGGSKREAKQEAARTMLLQLDELGWPVPSPFCRSALSAVAKTNSGGGPNTAASPQAGSCYMSLLNNLREANGLAAVEYELVSESGPHHARQFAVCARLGRHEFLVTSTTIKSARQLAAEQLYGSLIENLAEINKESASEVRAASSAHEKALHKYMQARREPGAAPPARQPGAAPPGPRAPLHASFIEPEKRASALSVLESYRGLPPERLLQHVARALDLKVERRSLAGTRGALTVLTLAPITPPLTVAGDDAPTAAAAALRCLRRWLVA